MNSKLPVVILVILAAALAVALFLQHHKATAERTATMGELERLRTTLTEEKLAAEAKGAQAVEAAKTSLSSKTAELLSTTTQLGETRAALEKTQGQLQDLQGQLASTKAAVSERDAQIKELTTAKDELEKHATELQSSIVSRDALIAETQRKLAASEGDRSFLLKELKRLQNEKGDLERQFNDLLVLKQQMKKLKEQYALTKRLEWSRRGLADLNSRKGGEILQRGFAVPSVVYTNDPALNVEFRRDGPATIAPAPEK
jgi:chromosome segregation ATPase